MDLESAPIQLSVDGIKSLDSKPHLPPREINQKSSWFLERFNNWRLKKLANKLTPDQNKKVGIAVASARAAEYALPTEQQKTLEGKIDKETFLSLSDSIQHAIDAVESESLLGKKVLQVDLFRLAVDAAYRKLQISDKNLNAAFDYWITNVDVTSRDMSRWQTFKELFSRPMTEIGIAGRLTVAEIGASLQSRFKRIGETLIDVPIKYQMAGDFAYVVDGEKDLEIPLAIQKVAKTYGSEENDVDNKFLHPDFGKRIAKSWLLQSSIYTLPRQILGWTAFGAFLQSQVLRETMDKDPMLMTGIAAAALVAGMAARMRIDYAILREHQYSPDILETSSGAMLGKVDSRKQLKSNHWTGLIGAPIDVLVSSLPPYAAAWVLNPPYSIPAYLLAMYVDQVVFSATNVGWGTLKKIGERKASHDQPK